MNVTISGAETQAMNGATGRWLIAAAILDAVEDGASRHCLWQDRSDVLRTETWHHHRLGVTVTFVGVE